EAELNKWPQLRDIVRQKVKPERDQLGSNPNNVPLKRRWWAYQAHRPDLYEKLAKMKRVLAHAQVSQYVAFSFLPTNYIYSQQLILFEIDAFSSFACVQSRPHEIWTRFF